MIDRLRAALHWLMFIALAANAGNILATRPAHAARGGTDAITDAGTQGAPGPCGGDCDHDRRVSVAELVTGVNIALGSATSATARDPARRQRQRPRRNSYAAGGRTDRRVLGRGTDRLDPCTLFGSTAPFDDETLAALYSDHDAYVSAFNEATDRAVQAGFILPPDAELMKAAAASSDIGR